MTAVSAGSQTLREQKVSSIGSVPRRTDRSWTGQEQEFSTTDYGVSDGEVGKKAQVYGGW